MSLHPWPSLCLFARPNWHNKVNAGNAGTAECSVHTVTNLVPKGMELMLTRGSGANAGICRLALVSDLKPGSCAMPGRAANGSLDPDSH